MLGMKKCDGKDLSVDFRPSSVSVAEQKARS